MTPLHLGPLHAIEWVMFLALLLGPVAALATTVLVVRRRDEREAALEAAVGDDPETTHVPAPRTPSERS